MMRRLRSRLRELAADQRGLALPAALFTMIASVGIASAAVMASVDVQEGAKHDSGAKSAIAAADAGANIATMRMGRYAASLVSSPCLRESGGSLVTTTAAGDGWCPPVAGTVGGATYVYRVSPAGVKCGSYDLCVVSTGTLAGVSRRILMTYNESSLKDSSTDTEGNENTGNGSGGSFEGLVGQDGIEMHGNADIHVGIGTNGDVTASGSGGSTKVCGDIRVGIGRNNNAPQCSGYEVTHGNVNLPLVESFMPSDIATHNSNNRLKKCVSANNPVECQKDTYTGTWSSNDPLSSSRSISLTSKSITVGGGDYWLCSLTMKGNSELIMAAGAKVRFFFDTPEHCGIPANGAQIDLSGTSRIVSTGFKPSAGNSTQLGFFLLGSTTRTTWAELNGNQSTNEFVFYAPRTNIDLTGNATYKGLIAGKRISIGGGAVIIEDAGYELPPELLPPAPDSTGDTHEGEPGARYYTAQSYVECIGSELPGTAPNSNC
jgi:hypothetical protein